MAENPFATIASGLSEKIFSGILWFGLAIILIAILGGVVWYMAVYRRKFNIRVKIKSERTEDAKIYFDKAAILYDKKDKNKYLRLLNTGVDLPVPPFKVLQHTNEGDYLEIWRKSEDEFIYLTSGKIDRLNILKIDGKLYPIAQTEQKQVEGDISYWNTKRKEKHRGLFDTETLLMKLLPYIPLFLGGIFMIFIMYILMDHLPTILSQLSELTRELKSLKGADVVTGLIIPFT